MLRHVEGRQLSFDLKGNWDYGARKTSMSAAVLKDEGFHSLFPKGLDVAMARFMGELFSADDAATSLINALIRDASNLADMNLMDYSLLIDMVDLCPQHVSISSTKEFTAYHSKKRLHLTPFTKTRLLPSKDHNLRPIYVNDHSEYLYYWGPHGEWHVAHDYKDSGRGLASYSEAGCPNEASKWFVHVGGDHEEGKYAKGWSSAHEVVVNGDRAEVEREVTKNNPGQPLVWVSGQGMSYIMTVGIIDMFMNGASRGFWNTFGSGITFSQCAPNDVDPIPAREYKVRFLRMIGYKDPDVRDGKYCGSCLGSRRRQSYTYLTSHYQQSQHKAGQCEWGS